MPELKSFQTPLVKTSELEFESHVMDLFQFQAKNSPLYAEYIRNLGLDPISIQNLEQIPFLPIQFFKDFDVKTEDWQSDDIFFSSGTTGTIPSKHHVRRTSDYHSHAKVLFESELGPVKNSLIVALLPSYLERKGSSLVSMVQHFIDESDNPDSGFYLHNQGELIELLSRNDKNTPTYLFAVSFALLDLAEKFDANLDHVTLIETGGMKGRRTEITKNELYTIIKQRLSFSKIYSEYGMTELMSQSYGPEGRFPQSVSLRVLIRDINDPFSYVNKGKTGGINVIDLANRNTCSFIETKDLGRINEDDSFEVLGRFDNSELRGCNLMVV